MKMILGCLLKDGYSAAWMKVNYIVNDWLSVGKIVLTLILCAAKVAQHGEPEKLPKCLCEQTRKMFQWCKAYPGM